MNIPLPKRKLPKKNTNDDSESNSNTKVKSENKNEDFDKIKRRKEELQRLIDDENRQKKRLEEIQHLPEFVKKGNNEQSIISFLRMKNRNFTDGALDLNIEMDDLENESLELYEDKGINLPNSIENQKNQIIDDSAYETTHYIEALSRNRFIKLAQDSTQLNETTELEKDNILNEIERVKKEEEDFENDIERLTFSISNNVSIIFLFAQGLLAGLSLFNIIYLFQLNDFNSFLLNYGKSVELTFSFTHCLTFGSLVGNGIKIVTTKKFYDKLKADYFNTNKANKIKRKLIVLYIAFTFFIVAFILELYLASLVPKIVYSLYTFTNNLLITKQEFDNFRIIYLVVDIIVIINYIINIFDVSKVNDLEYDAEK